MLLVTIHVRPLIIIAALLGSTSYASRAQDKFQPACDPFPTGSSEKHQVDKVCGPAGIIDAEVNPDLRDAKKQQGLLKNELCSAKNSSPKSITLPDLLALQRKAEAAHVEFGGTHGDVQKLPKDRTILSNLPGTTLREGDYVEFIGYLVDPHYSPASETRQVESINCHGYGHDFADIHLNLSEQPISVDDLDNDQKQQQLCALGSAEIIPHYRPAIFEKEHLDDLRGQIIRIRGHLMFDAEHYPCRKNPGVSQWKTNNPARMSLWEIHPVYTIDVCKSKKMSDCTSTSNSWVDLASWLDSLHLMEDTE